jgi:hypothetical protein
VSGRRGSLIFIVTALAAVAVSSCSGTGTATNAIPPIAASQGSVRDAAASAATTVAVSFAINAGGPAGYGFIADEDYVGPSTVSTDSTPVNVGGPNLAPAGVFKDYRTAPQTITYSVPGFVPSSAVHGFLFFEEPTVTGPGQRLLNVSLGTTTVASSFDIFATTGAQHVACSVGFAAAADASGTATITITATTGAAIVSGLKIYGNAASTPVPTPSPTPTPTPTPAPTPTPTAKPSPSPSPAASTMRPGFLGAFFRSIGPVPYGVLSATAPVVAPNPYPSPETNLFGSTGYCDRVAANGVSISTGNFVDPTKLANIVNLGVGWTRETLLANYIDQSHIRGPSAYTWGEFDSAQCAVLRNGIAPLIAIQAGPVNYDATPGVYSPTVLPNYKTASDFGQFCGVIATHESQTFGVTRYSIPGNEVNDDPVTWPGGPAEIAAYTQACYRAIKSVQPNATVYGLELDMDETINPPAFVQTLYGLGCGPGTCYDAISVHIFFPYPLAPNGSPCYPAVGGNYDLACLTNIQTAAHAPNLHLLIGETSYMVTSTVPSESAKSIAVTSMMQMLAAQPYIDGASYANVDECALYPTGYYSGGCLINTAGVRLPAYGTLASLAKSAFAP